MPSLRPDVCVCGYLLTWAGQRRLLGRLLLTFLRLISGSATHEPEYVRLCHTFGVGLGWIV